MRSSSDVTAREVVLSDTFETVLGAVVGALDLEHTDDGVVPRRLPRWTKAQLPEPVDFVVSVPSGVRIDLTTDAAWLELDVLVSLVPIDPKTSLPATFDLVVDGGLRETRHLTEGIRLRLNDAGTGYEPGPTVPPTTLRFELPGRTSRIEVWLPQGAFVRLVDARVADGATLVPTDQELPVWAHYGSSISHCVGASSPTATWPAIVARRAGVRLQSLGFAGQCQLDQFAARTLRDLPCAAISLKVGINVLNGDVMRERAFVPALHGFLDTIRDGHPTTPVLVCTPIWCPSGEDAPGPSAKSEEGTFYGVPRPAELAVGALTLSRMRTLITRVVHDRGDPHLHLMSGLDLFGPADAGLMPDDLHPDAEGIILMAERFLPRAFGDGAPFAPLRSG